jgi:uncharacterized protein DUF6644
LNEFFSWMEMSALGRFIRESGPWTYPVVNLLHILGVAALFGSTLIIDLRLLGLWRHVPLALLSAAVVPVAGLGFAVAATTGVGLLATNATEYAGNPFLLVKFAAIVLGLVNVLALKLSPAWQARGNRDLSLKEDRQLAVMGGLSLICWLTAVTAGRMIAYW